MIKPNFDEMAYQGKVIKELEELTEIFLFLYLNLVHISHWKPDKHARSSKNKKYYQYGNDTKLYANEAAIAFVERYVIRKNIEPNEEELENDNRHLFTYFSKGYIRYNGEFYIVEDLVKLFNLIYIEFKKEILNDYNKEYFLYNHAISPQLLENIINYVNELIDTKKINIKQH